MTTQTVDRRRPAGRRRANARRDGPPGQVDARLPARRRRDGRGLRGDAPQRQARRGEDAARGVQPRRRSAATRFLQEGYAANTIQHEGAVSVLDDDVAPDGSAFIVMELLEGETVEQRWERSGQQAPGDRGARDRRSAPRRARGGARRRASSTATSSRRTSSSRSAGALKVLDFGIAQGLRERSSTTARRRRAPGWSWARPRSWRPSRRARDWDEVDGRTDLWAVGATMFTLLVGPARARGASRATSSSSSARRPPRRRSRRVAPEVPRSRPRSSTARWRSTEPTAGPTRATMQKAVREAIEALRRGADAGLGRGDARRSGHAHGSDDASIGRRDPLGAERGIDGADVVARSRRARRGHGAAARRRAGAADQIRRGEETRGRDSGGGRSRAGRTDLARSSGSTAAPGRERRRSKRRARTCAAASWPSPGAPSATPARSARSSRRARDRIATLEHAAESAARDVTVHEAALVAHDPRALRSGVLTGAIAALLALALLIAPIVWRATRVVEPPIPHSSAKP